MRFLVHWAGRSDKVFLLPHRDLDEGYFAPYRPARRRLAKAGATTRRAEARSRQSTLKNRDPEEPLRVTLDRVLLDFERLEDRKQFGDHQEVSNAFGQVDQLELAALPADRGVGPA